MLNWKRFKPNVSRNSFCSNERRCGRQCSIWATQTHSLCLIKPIDTKLKLTQQAFLNPLQKFTSASAPLICEPLKILGNSSWLSFWLESNLNVLKETHPPSEQCYLIYSMIFGITNKWKLRTLLQLYHCVE